MEGDRNEAEPGRCTIEITSDETGIYRFTYTNKNFPEENIQDRELLVVPGELYPGCGNGQWTGEELIMIEQPSENNKIMSIIGCRYEETAISERFKEVCGSYGIVDERFKDIVCKCLLSIESGALKLEIEALNSKFISCLKVVADNLAFTQGFGRNARLAVTLREDDGFYLTYSGVVFKKIN